MSGNCVPKIGTVWLAGNTSMAAAEFFSRIPGMAGADFKLSICVIGQRTPVPFVLRWLLAETTMWELYALSIFDE